MSQQQMDDDPEMEIEYMIPDMAVVPDLLPDIFYDPIREKRRRMNVAGDQRIIRELDEIVVPTAGDAIADMEQCRFVRPMTAHHASVFCMDLRITTNVFKRVMRDFHKNPNTELSKRAIVALRVNRARIFQALSLPNMILESKHKFTYNWIDVAKSMEPATFLAILHTSQLLNFSPIVQNLLGSLSPICPEFAGLAAQNAFNRNHTAAPIMKHTLSELFVLLRFLERRWNYLEFVPDQIAFLLDVIIARMAQLLTVAQPEAMFVNTPTHRRLLKNGLAMANETCLQDFFWTLIPMYRTLDLRTQFAHYAKEIPFNLSDAFVQRLKVDLKERSKKQKNVELQTKFYTKYSRMCMRFSEFKRYVRDHPGGDHLSSSILTEMRGADAANLIQEKLAPLPWDLIDANQLEKDEMDVLYLMLFANRFDNVGKSKFDWQATAVRYRGDMVDEECYVERLREYKYPMIVQSFNSFGLFFENEFYDHRDATRSVIHWLVIIMVRFRGICEGSNFSSLHILIPKELKDQLGIRFKS